jgi:hypothetical protein
MLQGRAKLVLEFISIYRAASTASACRVAALNHEVRDHAVEYDVVVVTPLCETGEILACLWRVLLVEFKGDNSLFLD